LVKFSRECFQVIASGILCIEGEEGYQQRGVSTKRGINKEGYQQRGVSTKKEFLKSLFANLFLLIKFISINK